MNTTPDDLEMERLTRLLEQKKPSWQVTPLPPDPATEIFRKPAPPRRSIFSFDAIETNVGGGNGGGNSPQQPGNVARAVMGIFTPSLESRTVTFNAISVA